MPPKQFRLLSEDEHGKDGNNEDDGDDEDAEDADAGEEEDDEIFHRVKCLVENLLAAGQSALAVPAPSFGIRLEHGMPPPPREWDSIGAKHGVAIGSHVLSPEEARKWVGDDQHEKEMDDDREENADVTGEGESEGEAGVESHGEETGETGDEEEVEQALGGARIQDNIEHKRQETSHDIPDGPDNTL
jgi:hypothetical protein